jgi:glyoxylase-like metal-dependent hydrolase (beta-lactamase superfamily II)
MILEAVCVGQLQANCYILARQDSAEAVIIDPGAEKDKISRVLLKHRLRPVAIVNTHGHIDHIGADDEFGLPVYVYEKEAALLKDPGVNLSGFLSLPFSVTSEIRPLRDGQKIKLAGIELEVIHTPGHTAGGICLLLRQQNGDILFSGDSLFRGSIGRTDFSGGDEHTLIKSIREKLLVLADKTVVYPGHGPATTIGYEKRHNPFLI